MNLSDAAKKKNNNKSGFSEACNEDQKNLRESTNPWMSLRENLVNEKSDFIDVFKDFFISCHSPSVYCIYFENIQLNLTV